MELQYPLTLLFKKRLRGDQEIILSDATNAAVFYARQKLSANVDVSIYSDRKQTRKLCTIESNRIFDFGGQYHFTDLDGISDFSIKQQVKPPWKAHYQVYDAQEPIISIHNTNRFIKSGDTIFEYIPILNFFPGYIFRPTYNVTNESDGKVIMQMKKKPSLYKETFTIVKESQMAEPVQTVALLSLLLMTFLGRIRWSVVIS
ncbi:MAG: hypothetical protein GY845_06065 [Planctomycetes bacterium]|nr:hypothetical protein [Planctomycetota bacterium]